MISLSNKNRLVNRFIKLLDEGFTEFDIKVIDEGFIINPTKTTSKSRNKSKDKKVIMTGCPDEMEELYGNDS